jgi:hypothetical protein
MPERKEPSLPPVPPASPAPERPNEPLPGLSLGLSAKAGAKRPHGAAAPDLETIGQGIAGLLQEEALEIAGADTMADKPKPSANPANVPRREQTSAYTVRHEYGDGPDPGGKSPSDGIPGLQDGTSPLCRRLISQIAETMWFPTGTSDAKCEDRVVEAFDALQSIDPKDEIEGMLACQLVVTHRAALDCLRLSMIPATESSDRGEIIEQVDKLMAIYARNLEALDRHRGARRASTESAVNGAHDAIDQTLMKLKTSSGETDRRSRTRSTRH